MMFYHADTNTLIYDHLPNEQEVLRYVPQAKKLVNGYVAVPVDLYALQLLRYFGCNVIRPLAEYDWPHGPAISGPFASQQVRSNFLVLHPHALDLSDMGTGKTLAALWAADFVMHQYPKGECRALVVATLSTLERVWASAIFQNFMGRRSFAVLHGSAERRRRLLAEPHDFYIINHDGVGIGARDGRRQLELAGFVGELGERDDIKIAIIDEVGAYRDARSRRSRIARRVIASRAYVWGLTGTPTPNGPTDAYGIAKLINNAWGETFTSYQQRVMYRVSQWKWVPKADSHLAANKMLSPSIRYSLEDVVDLPEMTVQLRDVELTEQQLAAWKTLKNDLVLQLARGTVTIANEAALRLKLIQVACGQVYDSEHVAHAVDAKPRLSVLREVIEEAPTKLIVFAPLTSVVKMLRIALKEYGCEMIVGETSKRDRDDIIQRFESDRSPRVIVADPGCLAHGNTLVAASTVVWFGPTDKTELYLQGNKRIRRPGQTRTQTIVQLASSRIEREIFRRLEANEKLQGIVLQLAEDGEGL